MGNWQVGLEKLVCVRSPFSFFLFFSFLLLDFLLLHSAEDWGDGRGWERTGKRRLGFFLFLALGFWASGFWLRATGYWLLAFDFWLLAYGFWLLASGEPLGNWE